jgi:hypothetical protein
VGLLAHVSENTLILRDLMNNLRGVGKDPGLIGVIAGLVEKMGAQENDREMADPPGGGMADYFSRRRCSSGPRDGSNCPEY